MPKNTLRNAPRSTLKDYDPGTGKGTNTFQAAEQTLDRLRFASKALGAIGAGITFGTTFHDEMEKNDDDSNGVQVAKASIRATAATAGATALGGMGVTAGMAIPIPGVDVAVAFGLGTAGGWAGGKLGGWTGDAANKFIFDSGVDWSPWN